MNRDLMITAIQLQGIRLGRFDGGELGSGYIGLLRLLSPTGEGVYKSKSVSNTGRWMRALERAPEHMAKMHEVPWEQLNDLDLTDAVVVEFCNLQNFL